jgi:hypothetical protein
MKAAWITLMMMVACGAWAQLPQPKPHVKKDCLATQCPKTQPSPPINFPTQQQIADAVANGIESADKQHDALHPVSPPDKSGDIFNLLLVVFNGLLVAVGIGQGYIIFRTLRATEIAANAAKVAAEAIPIMERPYIFIHGISCMIDNIEKKMCIYYSVSNNGKMAARVQNVSVACGLEKYGKYPPLVIIADHDLLQVPILSADQERPRIPHFVAPWSLETNAGTPVLIDGLIFRVVVSYRGPFTKRGPFAKDYETSYTCKYQRGFSGMRSGFVEIEDPQYTYQT